MQSKLGLLMLLSTWLAHCPQAVKQFLGIPTSIPYLTAQVGKLQLDSALAAKCSGLFYNSFSTLLHLGSQIKKTTMGWICSSEWGNKDACRILNGKLFGK
jgi:hypothetical protein